MVVLITWEHENSKGEQFEMPMEAAYQIASKGGFYKAQIVGEFGDVMYEFKNDSFGISGGKRYVKE